MEHGTRGRHDETFRITSASTAHSEDLRGRERRYLIQMGIRSASFLLAVAFAGTWAMWVFLAASFFLPTIAVVIANGGRSPDPVRVAYAYDPTHKALEGPRGS